MATTIEDLRALGSSRVTLVCQERRYTGRVLADRIGDRAVNFLFAPEDEPGSEIVISLHDVSEIEQR